MLKRLHLATLLLLTASLGAQTTRNVPAQYATIQSAIAASTSGDTVLVAPGTYYESLDFLGKAITVAASGSGTILDGTANVSRPIVTFQRGETRNSILQGFTLQNARGGNAIYISASAPTIKQSIFSNNACNSISVSNGAPLITANTLTTTQNLSICGTTGGIAILVSGTPAAFKPLPVHVLGNTFENNITGTHGAALYGGPALVAQNIIRNNAAGTGSVLAGFSGTFTGNLVYGNTSNNTGFYHAAVDLDNNGYNLNGTGPRTLLIDNNTFSNNTVGTGFSYATDLYLGFTAGVGLVNNIFSSGTYGFPPVYCYPATAQSANDVFASDHNDFFNPAGGAATAGSCRPIPGKDSNLSGDPAFTNPTSGDFHLLLSSPAIDSGNNSYSVNYVDPLSTNPPISPELITDLDGNPRLRDATSKGYATIDMGVYEFQAGGQTPQTLLELHPSSYATGAPTLYAQLTSTLGTPTGSVNFFADGTRIATSLVNSSGLATAIPSPSFAPGAHEITATYTGSGIFSPATAQPFYSIIPKYSPTLTLTSSGNNIPEGVPVTYTLTIQSPDTNIFTPLYFYDVYGAVQLAQLTSDAGGIATYTTGTLLQGTHNLTAYYPGDTGHDSARASLTEIITAPSGPVAAPITATLTGTPLVSIYGTPTSLTFNETSAVPGTLTITENGTTINTSHITNGYLGLGFSALAVGTHSFVATFTPDDATHYLPATSNTVTLTVNPAPTEDFSLTPASASLTLATTHHLSTALTLTSLNNFAGPITLTCGPLPPYLTCDLPHTATLAANATSQLPLKLDTDAILNFALLAPLALLIPRRKRSRLTSLFTLLALAITLTACSGHQPNHTPPGDYPLTITATSGSLTHATTLTLHVTP